MADTASPPTDSASQSRQDSQRGRGRGRGRNRGRGFAPQDGGEPRQPDNRGSRRGGRGGNRGALNGPVISNGEQLVGLTSLQKKPAPPIEDGEKTEEDDEEDSDVCFICASPVVHHSVAPCNHRTCHICALRMRALYKSRDCAHCRVCINSIASFNFHC